MSVKIERVTDRYGLDPTELQDKYEDGLSLRQLEEWLNTRVVQSATQKQDSPLSLKAACKIASALSNRGDTDVPTKGNCRARLRSHGVDPERVTKDFVSYQTIRQYLIDNGVDTSRTDGFQPEKQLDAVLKLRHRLREVVDSSIDRLERHEYVDVHSSHVAIDMTVECYTCGTEWALVEFFTEEVACPCQ